MKAATGLLAVLLMLSCTALAQTASSPLTAPVQPTDRALRAALVQPKAPTLPPPPVLPAASILPVALVESTVPVLPPPPVLPMAQALPTATTQQAVAEGEAAKADPDSQPASPATTSPSAATPSTEAVDATADAVPAMPAVSNAPVSAPFTAGAKLFLEPMDGFEQLLSHAILKKKVPVVLVHEREEADFVLFGVARVKKAGWIKGWVESEQGKGLVSITDARTGYQVFSHRFKRADTNMTVGEIYKAWADGCAKDLKKSLEKK